VPDGPACSPRSCTSGRRDDAPGRRRPSPGLAGAERPLGSRADVNITTEVHRFRLPSFDAYFGPFERGGGSSGQALVSLPEEVRRAVREEIRRDLGDAGGPIGIEVEIRIASGRR
jgi:hypothetical protein